MASLCTTTLRNVLRAMRSQTNGKSSSGALVLAAAKDPATVERMDAHADAWNTLGSDYTDLIYALNEYKTMLVEYGPSIDSSSEDDLRKIAHRVGLELPIPFEDDADGTPTPTSS